MTDNTAYEDKVDEIANYLFDKGVEVNKPMVIDILESALGDVRELADKIVVAGAEMPDETAEVIWAEQILSLCPPEPEPEPEPIQDEPDPALVNKITALLKGAVGKSGLCEDTMDAEYDKYARYIIGLIKPVPDITQDKQDRVHEVIVECCAPSADIDAFTDQIMEIFPEVK